MKTGVTILVNSETLASIIESIVFVSGNAIAVKDIAEKLEVTNAKVLEAAKKLQEKYNEESGLNLLIFNNKLQFCSNPKNAENVAMVLNPIRERELSKSMLEVAAIIAYKQPVTRLDLEEIRGVDSEYAIQNLLKLNVIEIVGRKEAPGRPVMFGTTDGFLKRFQISSLDELPDYEQLLASIRGTNEKSSYLFEKDNYDENADPEFANAINDGSSVVFEDEVLPVDANTEELDEDFELDDVEEEELPDFLKGENVTKIG